MGGLAMAMAFGAAPRRLQGAILVVIAFATAVGYPRAASCQDRSEFGSRVIRRVRIIRQNVFSAEEKRAGIFGDDPWLDNFPLGAEIRWLVGPHKLDIARWANRIHFKTQKQVIERELLFKPGDRLKLALLAETERNLRAIGIFRNASVTAASDGAGGVDAAVFTKDAWTLDPQVSLSFLGGGNVTGGIGVAEFNLFGFGKAAEIFYSQELYRTITVLGYDDPRVWGTHWRVHAEGSEDSDGRMRNILLEYPFWSVEIPASVGGYLSYVVDQERLFGAPVANPLTFSRTQTAVSAWAERALVASPDLVRRVGVRFDEWDDTFGSVAGNPGAGALGLHNRRTTALQLTFTEWWPDFIKAYYLDQLGRPEDRDLDFAFRMNAGYSPEALGATANELVAGGTMSLGGRLTRSTFGWIFFQGAGRERAGMLRDAFVTGEGIVYQRLPTVMNRAQTFVADARLDLSSRLFADHQFVAGGDDGGLRGYPVNFIGGTSRLMMHLEDRVMIAEDLLHLVSLGGVAFFDGGEVWGRGRQFGAANFLASVGLGLRAAGTRGSLQIPVRLDFGVALVHHPGVNPIDISTGAGQAFGSFGRPFYAQDNALSVPENLAPDPHSSPYPFASPFNYPGETFQGY